MRTLSDNRAASIRAAWYLLEGSSTRTTASEQVKIAIQKENANHHFTLFFARRTEVSYKQSEIMEYTGIDWK